MCSGIMTMSKEEKKDKLYCTCVGIMMMSKQTQRGNCCSDQYNYCSLSFIIYFASQSSQRPSHPTQFPRAINLGYQSDQLIPLVIQLKTGVKEFDVHHNNGWSWMFCLQLIPSLQSPVPSPVSHQKNTNHSDLSRLRSLRIITAIELISTRSEYCHR